MSKPAITEQMNKKIIILDGAMGTMLQNANLTAEDFGGEEYDGCNEYLNITAPEVIESIHAQYLEAGADIIETNTFGATRIVLDDYNLGHRAYEINKIGAELAKNAADRMSTPSWPRYVAGAMGPTTKTLSVTGGTTFDERGIAMKNKRSDWIDGGAISFRNEPDTQCESRFVGIQQLLKKKDRTAIDDPGTIEPMGTTLPTDD